MKKICGLIIMVLLMQLCVGQDPHFSQYYASTATVNPANNGFFTGDVRIAGLYRQQWPQYGDPFVTGTASFEFKPGKFKGIETPDRFSIGGLLMYDRTPDGVLKSQHAYLMVAYHKALDEEGYHRIGAGFMGGYNERRLDMSQLTFADQFGSGGFVSASSEPISNSKISAFDLHAGLLYTYEDDLKTFYAGGSLYHLTNPKNYFLGNNAIYETIPKRFNVNAGANISLSEFRLAASFLYMRQAEIDEVITGVAFGIPLPLENSFLYAGSWYRFNESVIPTINLQWQNMNIGFSYDTYVSNKSVTKPRSMEFSISYRAVPYRDFRTSCFAF